MTRALAAFFLVASLLTVGSARADSQVQKDGPEAWPGKIMFGVDPLGVQLNYGASFYADTPASGFAAYKMNINIAGLIASTPQLSIWLGGEFNIGGFIDLANLEPGIFVRLTLEKLMRFPLVPMIEAGFSGPIYLPYGYGQHSVGGAFEFKVGGGVYYFILRNLGVGVTTHFAFGPGFYTNGNGSSVTGFAGYWDFGTGLRFAF